jgi:hypothetical protein
LAYSMHKLILLVNIQVGDTGPQRGSSKGESKNMRAFRHNNKKKVIRPVHGQSGPTVLCTGYCTFYYTCDLVATGHLKLKNAPKGAKARKNGSKAACPSLQWSSAAVAAGHVSAET